MINIGIIGAGRSGWELHAQRLQNLKGYRLVAMCDSTPARLQRVAANFNVKTYSDAGSLFADAGIDVVVVATPNSMHMKHAIAALQAGKHVVVEKPMAISVAEADAMLAAAERAGRLLVPFHNRHWDTDYQIVREIARKGILGDLLTVESRVMTYTPEWITYGAPEWNPAWRIQAAYGGGMLNDWGPHQMEQILDLLDEYPSSVRCDTRRDLWAVEVDDYFSLRLYMPSGRTATVEASNNARVSPPRWFIVGSEGSLASEGGWSNWSKVHVCRAVSGVAMDMVPQGGAATGSGRDMGVADSLSDIFYGDLAEVLATGRPPTVPAERSRDAIAILQAARESSITGQNVTQVTARGTYGTLTRPALAGP